MSETVRSDEITAGEAFVDYVKAHCGELGSSEASERSYEVDNQGQYIPFDRMIVGVALDEGQEANSYHILFHIKGDPGMSARYTYIPGSSGAEGRFILGVGPVTGTILPQAAGSLIDSLNDRETRGEIRPLEAPSA